MYKYKANYRLYNKDRFTYMRSVTEALAGFWINRKGEHSTGDDMWIFIPPSALTYIRKVKVKDS